MSFALDPRLAADTHEIGDGALSRVLLMDDARFPWLILVPRIAGARELCIWVLGEQACAGVVDSRCGAFERTAEAMLQSLPQRLSLP